MENGKNKNYLLVIALVFFILGLLRIVSDRVNTIKSSQRIPKSTDSVHIDITKGSIISKRHHGKKLCFNEECLDIKPTKDRRYYNPYIANIGRPDNKNEWFTDKRYCFKNATGKETSCLDIGINNIDLVAIGGYYCNTSNNKNNYECHINGSQVPDIQYDKNGQPTAYICTPKGTYEDSTGDCKELAKTKACQTAFCGHDPFSNTWSTQGDEASQWMFNFARCQWMRYNKTDHLDEKCRSTYKIP